MGQGLRIEDFYNPIYTPFIDFYYKDDAKELHKIIHKIIYKNFGDFKDIDMDDFYSVANDVFSDIVKHDRYDVLKGDFGGFLYNSLKNGVIDEIKKQNRDKRRFKIEQKDEDGNIILDANGKPKRISVQDIRLDAPIKDGEGITIGDTIQSDFDTYNEIYGDSDERVDIYLNSLPKVTRQIIEMKMERWDVSSIKDKLHLTEVDYQNHMDIARMNENIALFTKNSNRILKEGNKMDVIPIDLTDNWRMDKFPLGNLLDDMKDGKINRKHILQRKAYQWTERQKNKFLTRVLNGQPVPEIVICEQTINGKRKSHLIDGLQRLSYSELFRADGIVIKLDGAEFYEIPYKEYLHDDDGNILLDGDGDAIFKEKIFNVIGKKFSQFPKYLKDRFNKFNVNITTFFNCTDEQIAYHIRNYNNQEGMNKNQYELTGVNAHIAEQIKLISDSHPFFKDGHGKYTQKNRIKGDLDKVVVESIMTINFLDNWKKDIKDSFSYVNENSTDKMFGSLSDILDRICRIVDDKETKVAFSTVNSPIWFAVFDKFKSLGVPDVRFKQFIKYVMGSMEELTIGGKRFIEIYKNKSTRDKTVVISKINGLIDLMLDFLHMDKLKENMEEGVNINTFLIKNVGIEEEALKEDLGLFNETLDGLIQDNIKYGSKLLEKQNRPSLLAMVAYSYKEDKDLDKWLKKYAQNNNTYFTNQEKNYIHMKKDFERFNKTSVEG